MKRKDDRNSRLYDYYLQHRGSMTLEAMAGVFHLKSRQHVLEIVQAEKARLATRAREIAQENQNTGDSLNDK